MTDRIDEINERIRAFATERRWDQIRTPKDLSMAIGIEAAELQEIFLWVSEEEEMELAIKRREDIEFELADVLIYCLGLAELLEIDLLEATARKMTLNEARFPLPGEGDL